MRGGGKESWKHFANTKRTSEIDIPDKFKVINILRDEFDLHGLTDEALEIPGGIASARYPDLFIQAIEPQIAIELDGEGPHGNGDPIEMVHRDYKRGSDYQKLLPGIRLIIIYSAQTNGYQKDLVIEQLQKEGLIKVERNSN